MSLELIRKYSIRAKKSLGQNFLVDEKILESIATATQVSGRNIIEVGPGYGALTEKILEQNPKSLTLVELDLNMISILEERISFGELILGDTDFKIEHTDILDYEPQVKEYSVIANIPYYITSPILRHFLYKLDRAPENMLILMQRDVGDKILGHNKGKSSLLSLIVQKKCHVSEKILVPKESFIPSPKVESSVLYFETHGDYSDIDDARFLKLVKQGFCEVRKKLIKNLVKGGYDKEKIQAYYTQNNLSENTRGEELDIVQWIELCNTL